MLKKALIASLICLGGLFSSSAAPTLGGPTLSATGGSTNSSSGGVDTNAVIALIEQYATGGGGIVSNANNLTFVSLTIYTNDTPYPLMVNASVENRGATANGASSATIDVDTGPDGAFDLTRIFNMSSSATFTNRTMLTYTIAAGDAWRITTSGGAAIVSAGGQLLYFGSGTNSGSGTIPDGSITTNKIDSTFYSWVAEGSDSVSPAQVAAIISTNNAAGATNLYGGTLNLYITNLASFVGGEGSAIPTGLNKFNHVFSGTNNLITGSTSIFNVILNGNGGLIQDSIYSTMIGVNNPGGTLYTIEDSALSTLISVNDAYIYHTYGSVIIGGEHCGIVGSDSNANDGFNAIVGGDIIYIGNEFDTTSIVSDNASLGGYVVHMSGHAIQNANIAGEEKHFENATNAASIGGEFHRLTGRGAVAIGSHLTNSENYEVMLGKLGTEVRIKTNGITTVKGLEAQSLAVSGNFTNGSPYQLRQGGGAGFTNFYGSEPYLFYEGYADNVFTYYAGDEFSGGPIYSVDYANRTMTFHVPPGGSGSGLTNLQATNMVFSFTTNAWAVNTALGLGTNYYFSGNTASCGITGIVGIPAASAMFAELTIKATGDITFTNPVAIYTSDMVDTRTITNGNTACIAVTVQPGFFTNLAIVQFK